MTKTSAGLLERLRDPQDSSAWRRFFGLYAPLLFEHARARGLAPADAEEVRDQCWDIVIRRMKDFVYDPARGRFKSWLFKIINARIVDRLRRRRAESLHTGDLAALGGRQSDPVVLWEAQWREEHLRHCFERARTRVSERVFQAFELLLVHDRSVTAVCDELGMNANQVYKAKAQVLQEVRALLAQLDPSEPST